MTIARVNGSGWGVGSSLTSAQANALDINTISALDKRSGQSDTLQSVVSCSGAGRIIPTIVAGTDANTSYTVAGGNTVINASSGLTAPRNYTLSNTGAIAGDRFAVLGGAQDVTVKNNGGTTLLVVGTGNTGNNQSRWGDFLFDGSNWVVWQSSFGPQQQRQFFTSNGTLTVPADCWKLLVIGAGPGGGGGGGSGAGDSTSRACGGGGGGAPPMITTWVDTSPGSTFAITAPSTGGASGGGGAGATGTTLGSSGSNGADGSTATFGSTLTFYGGQGGTGGIASSVAFQFAPGGGPAGGTKAGFYTSATVNSYPNGVRIPGEGGYGASGVSAAAGAPPAVSSTTGGSGSTSSGAAGATGTDASGLPGGGGGGGGGASPFGSGGAGGGGGNAVSNSTPPTGGAGTAGTAGSAGAGGGGGGGGGVGGGSGGGTGGNGASGALGGGAVIVVIPIR